MNMEDAFTLISAQATVSHGDDPLDEDSDSYDEMDALEEAMANCHQVRDGTCMASGSEYCEFECPFRNVPSGQRKKRKVKPPL
jgi:hypothetical protein